MLQFCPTRQIVAQSNIVFYHTENFYNAAAYNPAALVHQKDFTLNVFPLSGTGISFNNRDAIDKLVQITFTDKYTDKTQEVFRSIIKKDLSYNHVEFDLLNFGINTPNGSFNFHVKEKAYAFMRYGSQFSRFLADTVQSETLALNQEQSFPTEAAHLREYSVGYASELVKNKLTFGVRAKLYLGKSFLSSSASGMMIEQEGNFFAKSYGDVFLSVPATDDSQNGTISEINVMNGKSIADYVLNTGNTGVGLDLGITYKINPQVEFTASILDLGSIKWKKYLYQLNFDDGLYQIENVHLDPNTNELIKETSEVNLIDDIAALYTISNTKTSHQTQLPTTLLAGLNYKFSPEWSIGVVNRTLLIKNMGYNSFAALANYRKSENLTLIGGIGFYDSTLKNIPLGLTYQWRAAQFFLGTDNFLSFFAPKFSDYTSINVGIDFNLFGPKLKYEEVDYLPFFRKKKQRRVRPNGLLFKGIN
ncbi:DUF5723 family protein [Mangrovibacterium sp.]|uniref:DUF5723 family protein n=1 Tax=Mangrovibacterium sp. TaxID=1961364 RepID=UPI003561B773